MKVFKELRKVGKTIMNLIEGIQTERKRVEKIKKQYEEIGDDGKLALIITINPALKEADESIASNDITRMVAAFQSLKEITG